MRGESLTTIGWDNTPIEDHAIYARLNLGSGSKEQSEGLPGYTRVDSNPATEPDILCDLLSSNWPFISSSVNEVVCSHLIEHFDGKERIHFFSELYRICANQALIRIATPHWGHEDAYSDPTHKFPPITRKSYEYLSAVGRKLGGIAHYGFPFDYEITQMRYELEPHHESLAADAQAWCVGHQTNVVKNLVVTLVVHKPARDAL